MGGAFDRLALDELLIASSRFQNLINGPSPKNSVFTKRLGSAGSVVLANACPTASLLTGY